MASWPSVMSLRRWLRDWYEEHPEHATTAIALTSASAYALSYFWRYPVFMLPRRMLNMHVATLFGVTTLLLLLYKMRCYLLIYGWLFLSVGSLLSLFGGFVVQQLLTINAIPIDWPSSYLLLYNFSIVGTLLVFWTEIGCGPNPPRALQQGYLVVASALLAWSATKLPEWSTWGILLAVALWDVVAVLTPQVSASVAEPSPATQRQFVTPIERPLAHPAWDHGLRVRSRCSSRRRNNGKSPSPALSMREQTSSSA